MSGGSFNYLYCQDIDKLIYGGDLGDMVDSMRNQVMTTEQQIHDGEKWRNLTEEEAAEWNIHIQNAADELEKHHLNVQMYRRIIENNHGRLANVMKAWEWMCSSDSSMKGFIADWKKFLGHKDDETV